MLIHKRYYMSILLGWNIYRFKFLYLNCMCLSVDFGVSIVWVVIHISWVNMLTDVGTASCTSTHIIMCIRITYQIKCLRLVAIANTMNLHSRHTYFCEQESFEGLDINDIFWLSKKEGCWNIWCSEAPLKMSMSGQF